MVFVVVVALVLLVVVMFSSSGDGSSCAAVMVDVLSMSNGHCDYGNSGSRCVCNI